MRTCTTFGYASMSASLESSRRQGSCSLSYTIARMLGVQLEQ